MFSACLTSNHSVHLPRLSSPPLNMHITIYNWITPALLLHPHPRPWPRLQHPFSSRPYRILLSLLEEFDPVTYKQSQQLSSPCADHGRQLNLTSPAVDSAPSTFRPPKLNSLKTEKRRGHFLTTPSHHSPIRTALLIHICALLRH